MQLDINDIDVAAKAIRHAQARGAFELEESAQLLNTVLRLESFVLQNAKINAEEREIKEDKK